MRRAASVDLFSLAMEDTKDSLCLQARPSLCGGKDQTTLMTNL